MIPTINTLGRLNVSAVKKANKKAVSGLEHTNFSMLLPDAASADIADSVTTEIAVNSCSPLGDTSIFHQEDELDEEQFFKMALEVFLQYRNNIVSGRYNAKDLLLLKNIIQKSEESTLFTSHAEILSDMKLLVFVELAKFGI